MNVELKISKPCMLDYELSMNLGGIKYEHDEHDEHVEKS